MTIKSNNDAALHPSRTSDPIAVITEILKDLRFGAIQLTVHDGKLVQLDVTEKRRFTI